MSERLTTTIKHFKDGITSMGMTAAQHSIESWKSTLEGYEGAIFATIATDLGHLHEALSADSVDGKKVSKLLAKLGKETAKSAKDAGDGADHVRELGDLLEKAAHDLDAEKVKS
ncbi:MAG: hypothetical protein NVS2B8_18450 [Vulcanimicrobiaceae bacterium]